MRSRLKLVAVAAIVAAGAAGAWWFRRPAPVSTADPVTQHALERRSAPRESTGETAGQLLGRIEPAVGEPVASDVEHGLQADPGGSIVPFARRSEPARPSPAVATASDRREIAAEGPAASSGMPTDSPWSAGGNNRSVTSAVPRPAAAPRRPAAAWKKHRVVDGDTLSSLAEHYLRDAGRWYEIYQLNQDQLADPDVLPIGAKIKVPESQTVPSSPVAPPQGPQTSLASDRWTRFGEPEIPRSVAPLVPIEPGTYRAARSRTQGSTYRVQPSDTLVEIARQFYGDGQRFREIYEANRDRIPDPNNLTPGLLLVIP